MVELRPTGKSPRRKLRRAGGHWSTRLGRPIPNQSRYADRGVCSNLDRKAGRNQTMFEDAPAAIGKATAACEAFQRIGDRLWLAFGTGRQVLDQVVAESVARDVIGVETVSARHRGLCLGHWSHRPVRSK